MTPFMGEDFLLCSETARRLYHDHAATMPILDFHNHLDPQAMDENTGFLNIGEAWLKGDHYKWRALRAAGVPEALITGTDTSDYQKFTAWAQTLPKLLGNPLYHWTHLELKRYFDIHTPLNGDTADTIWHQCNERLAQEDYRPQGLLAKMKVTALCTTDDPADDLKSHRSLLAQTIPLSVTPTFRPEKAMAVDKPGYRDYIARLGHTAGLSITSYTTLVEALSQRMDAFEAVGCRISDHSLDAHIYEAATPETLEEIFQKAMVKAPLTPKELRQFKGGLLKALAQAYSRHHWVMQLHIGALRNNNTRAFTTLGADTGFDSLDDFNYAAQLSHLLDAMDLDHHLPKTILYYLNPKDAEMLMALCGNFQDGVTPGKIQLGSAWWFCDHKRGMEHQLSVLEACGILSQFVGMVTDSRSFLSFPRHEYFRRILCNHIGQIVERGEYPNDTAYLGSMVEAICYHNANQYIHSEVPHEYTL